MRDGSIGYWHHTSLPRTSFDWTKTKKDEIPKIDAIGIMQKWKRETLHDWVDDMAAEIGVHPDSANHMGVAWASQYQAWAWPMSDGNGRYCGIRLRSETGRKWAVTGSRQGVFLPHAPCANRVFLPEGPTDTCALLSLGVFAIGRPSCSGGLVELKNNIVRLHIREAVIIADNDEDKIGPTGLKFNPGYDGARQLQAFLPVPSCIIAMPTKDARSFLSAGGDCDMLNSIASSAVWGSIEGPGSS